jgi:hypothetical protein
MFTRPDGRNGDGARRLLKPPRFCSIVDPENPIGIEIIELINVGFSGHGRNIAVVSAVLSRVFGSRADLQTEILALRHQIVVLQRQTPKPKLKPADLSGSVYLNSGRGGVRRSGA